MRLVFRNILLFIPFLLTSCIQDYQLDYSKSQEILTLNAELNHSYPANVLIALPKAANQYGDYVTPSDAEVIMYENGSFFEQLSFDPSADTSFGLYTSKKKIEKGNSYRIEAKYRNLPMISAHQKVPALPEISNVFFGKEFSTINNEDTLPVVISLNMNDTSSRRLAVYSYLNVEMEVVDEFGNTQIKNFEYRIDAYDDGSGFRDHQRYWTKTLPASNDFNFNLILYSIDSLKSESVKSVELIFIISALSEEGFLYRDTYRKRNKDNYGEPNIVYSNIKDGLGIFSAKTSVRKVFKVK